MNNNEILLRVEYYEKYNSHLILVCIPNGEFAVKLDATKEDVLKKQNEPEWFWAKAFEQNASCYNMDVLRADKIERVLRFEGKMVETNDDNYLCKLSLMKTKNEVLLMAEWNQEYDDLRTKYIGGRAISKLSDKNLVKLEESNFKLSDESLHFMFSDCSHKESNGYSDIVTSKDELNPDLRAKVIDEKQFSFVFK